jgi:predicted glutamine amidotransferase
MVHSRGVSSVRAATAEPPVAREARTGVLTATCVSTLVAGSHRLRRSSPARQGATTTNGDGFGVGWYEDGEPPRVYRSTHPAWNDRNLPELAAGISSPLFFAHIRASIGSAIQETNVHPLRSASSRGRAGSTTSSCRFR